MNRKIIKCVIIILAVIFAFIGIEVGLRKIASVTEKIKSHRAFKKEEEAYQKTEKYATEVYLESSIESMVKLIREERYNELFERLSPDYKEFLQLDSVEKFKQYMKDYMVNPQSISLISYYLYQNKYVCKVSVTLDDVLQTYNVIVEPHDDTYYVIFDDILSIKNISGKYTYSNNSFSMNIHYKVRTTNSVYYAVDIKNNTTKSITGSFAGSYLVKSNRSVYSAKNDLSQIEILPSETKLYRFEFIDYDDVDYDDVTVNIRYSNMNNEVVNCPITLLFDELYD